MHEGTRQPDLSLLPAAILEAVDSAFVVLDSERRLIFHNIRYLELFNLDPSVVENNPPMETVVRFAIGRDQRLSKGVEKAIERLHADIDAGQPVSTLIETGARKLVKRTTAPLPGFGHILSYLDVTTSLTHERELKQSKEILSQLAENIREVFWLQDVAKNKVIYVSPAYEEIWGLDRAELYQDPRAWTKTIFPVDKRHALENAKQRQIDGVYDEEYRVARPDGTMRWVRNRAFPINDADGNVYRLAGIAEDITARKLSEEHLAGHYEFLKNLDRINLAMVKAENREEMLGAVLDEVLKIYSCDRAWLLSPCDPCATHWEVPVERTASGFAGLGASGSKVPMTPEFAALIRELLAVDQPLSSKISLGTLGEDCLEDRYSIRSRIMIAVRPRNSEPWIFGMHQCTHERHWTVREKELFRQIARRLDDGLSMMGLLKNLTASEERFRSLVSSSADWIWESDREGRFTYASEKVEKILGFKPSEVVGRFSWDFMPQEEAQRVRGVMAAHVKAKAPIFDFENWNVTRDGKLVCLLTNGSPILSPEGVVLGYRGVDKDITAKKHSEEALREREKKFSDLFMKASVGILLVESKSHRITEANPEAARILGFTAEELKGRDGHWLIHPEDVEKQKLISDEEAFSDDDVWRQERRYRHKNGGYVPVSTSISRTEDKNMMVMFQDLTLKKRIEEQLFQAQKMEAVGTLASGVAHDFNNLLQAILGFSQLLAMDSGLGASGASHLRRIESAASRGATLVKNLLTFSRSERSSLRPLNVNESIAETVEILGRTLPKMISITTELTNGLPLIQADPAQLEQVLINLGTNARDAMQEGGTIAFTTEVITVGHDFSSLHPEVGKGRYVCIRVRDTGVGISGELQKHIFEPFYTTKEVGKGTGLGLSTAYGIVKNHEGHIFCESSLGAGTTFTILLPEAKAQPAPAEEEESRLPHHEKKAVKGTLLVVDDDEDIREVAFISLSRLGYMVLTADSGEAALKVYAQHAGLVHAVLLDLGMPGMGGEKCLKEILKINREAMVVVASGYGLAAKVDDLLALGAKAFVTKPYRFAELDLTLGSLAER